MAEAETELAEACARAMYAADAASRRLGIEIDGVEPGRATARMRVTETMINGHDICHGGYVFLLADTAFAFACNTYGRAAVAAGADGLMVEVHPDPTHALSDGFQALTLPAFRELMAECRKVAKVLGIEM